jgi:hypothetical protein
LNTGRNDHFLSGTEFVSAATLPQTQNQQTQRQPAGATTQWVIGWMVDKPKLAPHSVREFWADLPESDTGGTSQL